MKMGVVWLLIGLVAGASCTYEMTSEELLDKAIAYHDPDGSWSAFNGELNLSFEGPAAPDGDTYVSINLPESFFYTKRERGDNVIEYEVKEETCTVVFNGRREFTDGEIKEHRLNCEGAKRMRNYYTYLYGLPMKLKDAGTFIDEAIEQTTFKGKEYLVLNVRYDEHVGSDIWRFYFDPKTYAMEVYQFFKPDEEGNINPESGEYIMLSEEKMMNGIKMPRIRSWYFNKGDEFLGTDTLN